VYFKDTHNKREGEAFAASAWQWSTNKKKEFKWRKLIKAYKVAHYNNAQSSTHYSLLTIHYSTHHLPFRWLGGCMHNLNWVWATNSIRFMCAKFFLSDTDLPYISLSLSLSAPSSPSLPLSLSLSISRLARCLLFSAFSQINWQSHRQSCRYKCIYVHTKVSVAVAVSVSVSDA